MPARPPPRLQRVARRGPPPREPRPDRAHLPLGAVRGRARARRGPAGARRRPGRPRRGVPRHVLEHGHSRAAALRHDGRAGAAAADGALRADQPGLPGRVARPGPCRAGLRRAWVGAGGRRGAAGPAPRHRGHARAIPAGAGRLGPPPRGQVRAPPAVGRRRRRDLHLHAHEGTGPPSLRACLVHRSDPLAVQARAGEIEAELGEPHATVHLRSAYVPATPERYDSHS